MGTTSHDDPNLVRCEACATPTPAYDTVNCGSIDHGYRLLCSRCFNAEMAMHAGVDDFEDHRFDRIVMTDCTGQAHEFHFRTHLFGAIVSLEAFELAQGVPNGYRFQIIGEAEGDLFNLLGRLVERMRRALGVKHLEQSEHGLQIAGDVVRAHIECNESEDERTPRLVIDGREISWHDFGRMLMTYEGWQFRMHIVDRSDEV